MGAPSTVPLEPSAETDEDDLIGQVIGGTYRLERAIGEGGTGRVYEAHHVRIPTKRFAIKVLHVEFLRHAEAWGRFQREAKAAAAVDHPNIVGVYDVNRTEDGRPYVVFDYLEGIDLGDLIDERGPLPPKLAAAIVQQICRGLSAAHDRGVIHRDIKPQNIWLTGDPDHPQVKVLDFGVSRLTDDASTNLTQTGALLGTPAYMSPEQARGEQADHPTDIYGAGTILYATLTGRPPFVEENVQRTLIAVMSEEPPRPRSIVPAIPESLEMVIQRAMAPEPADRYPSADALAAALERFVEVARPLPSSRPPPPPSSPLAPPVIEGSPSRPMLVVYLAATFALALFVAATAIVGVTELFGGLNNRELALLLIALLGTALTPVWLVVRHVRAKVWDNGVRVRELRRRLRKVLITAAAAYGASALVLRLLDTVVARFVPEGPLGAGGGPGWRPFNITFAIIAAVAAVLAWILDRSDPSHHRLRRAGIATVIVLSAGLLSASVIVRTGRSEVQPLTARVTAVEGLRAEDATAVMKRYARVEPDELAAAVARGREALVALNARYPRDPDVLQALALSLGRDEKHYLDATTTLAMLFALEPEYTKDRALRVLVSKAAQHDKSRDAALELKVTAMGTDGLDQLYDLMNKHKVLRPKIETMLASPEIRQRFSPALAIAYDLRSAADCAARLPLLDRATRHGDERTVAVLAPLSERSKRGCGRYKRSPCPPPCEQEAEAFQTVVRHIQERLKD